MRSTSFSPPATKTFPLGNNVAVCPERPMFNEPTVVNEAALAGCTEHNTRVNTMEAPAKLNNCVLMDCIGRCWALVRRISYLPDDVRWRIASENGYLNRGRLARKFGQYSTLALDRLCPTTCERME